ncbi:MAG: 1-acyl-sn-glycerol-3-phosphate acyltransferase [Gemmatimonadota bacterium]
MFPSWLHRHMHRVVVFAARTYYRVTVAGPPVPPEGPVLLVANHPNSLLDPALVSLVANRPIRFLARAGLFEQKTIGWLVRASGAIPVFQRSESRDSADRNRNMFSAAHAALLDGHPIGIFPEGLSHSEPSLAPMKTGAARIALGVARETGRDFPILPVGLTFRGGKERFRSDALLLVGRPIRWGDLAKQANEPLEPARLLTARIEEGLQRVTVSLGSWGDFPVVEGAEAIHDAEFGRARSGNPVRWLARMRGTAAALEEARSEGRRERESLEEEIVEHVHILESLGLRPHDLHQVPRAAVAARWALRNVLLFGVAAPLAILGSILFLVPYRLVGWVEPRLELPPDKRATYKVLGGAAAAGLWVLILATILRYWQGWQPAIVALLALPLLGILTVAIRDRWQDAVSDLRRILILKGQTDLRNRLMQRQRRLAERIRTLQEEIGEGPHPPSPAGE